MSLRGAETPSPVIASEAKQSHDRLGAGSAISKDVENKKIASPSARNDSCGKQKFNALVMP